MTAAAGDIVVLGAGSLVAHHLAAALRAQGRRATFIGRSRVPDFDGMAGIQLDATTIDPALVEGRSVVVLTPLPITAVAAPRLAGAKAVVALGSTSLWARADETNAADRATVEGFRAGEQALHGLASRTAAPVTVLRPTLIWDGERDRNVTSVARFIARFGFFPVASPGSGGRQPVHAADVAAGCLAALARPAPGYRAFDLPGGETLSYRTMVERIFAAMARPPRILALPQPALTGALATLRAVTGAKHSPSLFARMNVDQVFDGGPASAALLIKPRPFEPAFPWFKAG
jgi:nucleoside-diphosphate-sugar epimerase